MAAGNKAAHLNDEAYRMVGLGQQLCGMSQSPVFDKVTDRLSVGTFSYGISQQIVVGTQQLGHTVAVHVAVGIGLLLLHQSDDALIQLLRTR